MWETACIWFTADSFSRTASRISFSYTVSVKESLAPSLQLCCQNTINLPRSLFVCFFLSQLSQSECQVEKFILSKNHFDSGILWKIPDLENSTWFFNGTWTCTQSGVLQEII